MGSAFNNPTITPRRASQGQRNYLNAKKTDRAPKQKTEETMQLLFANWIRITLPSVHFYSDTASGAFNSAQAKETHNLQQSAKGLPDMTIFAARRGFHGLCLELKPDGVRLKLSRDSKVTKVYKDKKGKIVGRDLAPRKKGDWKDMYIERQHQRHVELREEGYCATFVIGLEQAKKMFCWYFDIEYVPPVENTALIF